MYQKKLFLPVMMLALLLGGCLGYGGKGGMTKYKVTEDAYLHHYHHGFTGEDAMGWDPQLVYVWSRLGAAQHCGIPFNEPHVLQRLNQMNDIGDTMHRLNGIQYHQIQISNIPNFCTQARVAEIQNFVQRF